MSGLIHIDTVAAVSAVADLALKGTVVLAAAGLATLALRRASAAARHLVWTLAFAGLLALPVLGVAVPRWQIPILPARAALPSIATASAEPVRQPAVAPPAELISQATPEAAPAPRPVPPVAAPAVGVWNGVRDALGGIALLAWMVGALLALVRLAASVTRVHREARSARPLTDGPAVGMRDRLVWRLGIDRPVVLLQGPEGCMPLTWGIQRPRVLLPAGTEAWPADRLEAVLTHELAHVRRRDCAWQLVAEAACALHWFNPLAWAAARRLRLESEHACDDQVLLTGSCGADYAEHLLDVARTVCPPRGALLAAVPMARPSQLITRLHAVLSAERARGPVSPRLAVPALLAGGALLALIAALTPARAGAAEPFAITPEACGRRGAATFDEETDGKSIRTMVWGGRGCSGSARIQGSVRFADDFTSVRSIRPGGLFHLLMRDGERETEIVIRPGANGRLHRGLRGGGRELPWSDDAERWLAVALPELMRHTRYAEDVRAADVLAQQGAEALVGATDLARGEALRAEYADALLGPGLDPAAMRAALDRLATQESGAGIPDLLIRSVERLPADAQVQAAYLRAASRIQDPGELRRVLAVLAGTGRLRQAGWIELFRQSRRIRSQRELRQLLGAVAPALPADRQVEAEYFAAAQRMEGDADRRRAMVALVGGGRADVATQVRVLAGTPAVASPAERERMLTQLAPVLTRDVRVESAFRAAARSVDDAARARVMRARGGAEESSAAADTVPTDRLNDPEATTILIHEDRTAGDGTDVILLARNVQLTSDRTGIARISADGWVVFREEGSASRRVRITQSPTGELRHEWSGDFDGIDREAWLQRLFTHFADATRPNRRW
jgi:beta-lactamase regulating signal transducer with metallopeptidase domain